MDIVDDVFITLKVGLLSLQSFVNNAFEQQSVNLVKVDEVLCSDGYCPVGTLSISYYEDDDHLNLIGNALLAPLFKKHLKLN